MVKRIKQQRLKWLGHIWRAGPGTTVYSVLEWEPEGKPRLGRPRSKWLQEVREDLDRVKINNCQEKVKNRKL